MFYFKDNSEARLRKLIQQELEDDNADKDKSEADTYHSNASLRIQEQEGIARSRPITGMKKN